MKWFRRIHYLNNIAYCYDFKAHNMAEARAFVDSYFTGFNIIGEMADQS